MRSVLDLLVEVFLTPPKTSADLTRWDEVAAGNGHAQRALCHREVGSSVAGRHPLGHDLPIANVTTSRSE